MQYRKDKYGNDLSVLGYGCMRFTQKGGRFDTDKAEAELLEAFRSGVNYFDTAYIYTGSEALIGNIFEKHGIREQLYIATKLPHYMLKKSSDFDKYFETQLKRLRTDYIDYYLMHMLNDVNSWNRLCDMGILTWLEEKKKSGQIRQVGFSYHGNSDAFMTLLDAYDWDFTQIQYNYLDVTSQAGETGLKYAAKKGIPVIIMEPLRGGRLVNDLPQKAQTVLQAQTPTRSAAEWGLRWLYNQPEVTCVLSGMNSLHMVKENIRIADETTVGGLTQTELDVYPQLVEAINEKIKVGCTGCRYCMPCPTGVDIPGTFSAYNRKYTDGLFTALREYTMCTTLRKTYTGAANCIKCGKCETHCPQNIPIREELVNAKKALEILPFKIVKAAAPLIMRY